MPKLKRKKVKAIKVDTGRHKYSKYYGNTAIDNNIVLYRTNGSVNISGNPYVIFMELVNHPEYKHLKHYFVISNKKIQNEDILKQYATHPNVKFIKQGSNEYLEALTRAKYIVYNNSLPTFFIKKEGQILINTWDYTPFWKIGIDVISKFMGPVWNTQKNFYSCDYLISPNKYTTNILFQAYNLKNLFEGTIIEAGQLTDSIIKRTEKQTVISKLESYFSTKFDGRKIILYAPSARKIDGKYIDNAKVIKNHVARLQKELSKDYVILLKVESTDYDSIVKKKMDLPLVPEELEDGQLYAAADLLITDYNHSFFEYLSTGRPILFFDYDLERYNFEREAYLSLDTLPGAICLTVKDLIKKIHSIEEGTYDYKEKYEECVKKFAPHNDGLSALRVIGIIFGKKDNNLIVKDKELLPYIYKETTNKKKILLHIGTLNKIVERELCYRILRNIDYDQNVVVVDGNDIYAYQEVFSKINEGILIVNSRFEKNKTESEKKHLKDLKNITDPSLTSLFHREFISMYGGITFDSIIDTVGKKTVWMNVVSAYNCEEKSLKLIQKPDTKEFLDEYLPYMDNVILIDGEASEVVDKKVTYIPKDEFLSKDTIHSLNVLFISAFDSTNYVFVNLIKELTIRGHQCTVVVKDKDDNINNKMYIQENIPFIEIDEFDMKMVNIVDFAFSAPLKYACYDSLYKKLNASNKFIITFASLFSSIVMGVNPDLALSIGTSKFDEFEENGLRYNQVAIGNPQYDRLIDIRNTREAKDITNIKKVLIIEQGAYPYGHKGKTQLANVFCEIAKNNPNMTFTVKPRYLPSEKGKQLHVLSEHIYDFIHDKPDNLILLKEATVLEDIILDFDAAITTWSTAYLDAALLGLPIILIDGLDSIDVYNVRNQRINAAYDRLRHSGCVVNYKDLYNNPLPFRLVDEKYLAEEIYEPHLPCVPRVLELLEYLYKELIVTDKRWKNIHQYTFQELVQHANHIPLIDVSSNEYRQRKRLFNETNKILQKFIFENRCMGQVLDISPIYDIWNYNVTEETTKDEITDAIKTLRATTANINDKFFMEHFDLVCKDRILQDYYFQWLFTNKKYQEILNYDDILICPESLYFYRAVILYKKHKYKLGTSYMAQFFEISNNKECKDLRKDMAISAYLWKGRLGKYFILYYLDRYQAYEVIGSIDPQNVIYQRDIMLYYRVKSFIKRGMYQNAVELCEEYSRTMFKKSKAKSMKLKIKHFVGKLFYSRTESLLQSAKENL